jgi:acyl-CoA thioesterase I
MKNRKAVIAAAVAAVFLLAWLLWPSPYGRVKNLDTRGRNVIAFGDSLTAGYGAGEGEDYPSRLAAISGIPVINAGISGDTTATALERIDDVLAQDPRIVIVGLGGNDFLNGVDIAVTETNLREIVRKLHDARAMVILLGFKFPSLNANYEKMYARVADEERCLLVAGVLAGILRDPALKSDAIHPNAKGYELMARRLARPLRKLAKKANPRR